MKKLLLLSSLVASALAIASCGAPAQEELVARSAVGGGVAIGPAGQRVNLERFANLTRSRQARPVAEYIGRYSRSTGRLTFEPAQEDGPSGGRPLFGYVGLNTNTVSLDDNGTTIAGPGMFGGGSCSSTQVCAVVTLTNDSTRLIENTRVEINNLTGATIANGDALGTGYPSTAGNAGGWSYGSINPSSSNSAPWIFNYTGDFTFNVKVWGTYTRTGYSASARNTITAANNVVTADATWSDSTPAWRDACLTAGSELFSNQSGFTTATTTIPFPFTVYDTTVDPDTWADSIEVSSAGTVSLIGVPNGSNIALSSTSASDYTYYAFWDNLVSNSAPGRVCAALDSTSSAPNRRFVVTWKNVSLASTPDSRLTFSMVFQEGTDKVWLLYHRWSATSSSCSANSETQGNSATIGVRGNGTGEVTQISHNTASLGIHPTTCPGSGVFYVLTATPANP
jgi:hypothetical protein